MAWTKDTNSLAPKIVYVAPESAYPIIKVIYDPNATNKWTVIYDWLNSVDSTVDDIEALIGL